MKKYYILVFMILFSLSKVFAEQKSILQYKKSSVVFDKTGNVEIILLGISYNEKTQLTNSAIANHLNFKSLKITDIRFNDIHNATAVKIDAVASDMNKSKSIEEAISVVSQTPVTIKTITVTKNVINEAAAILPIGSLKNISQCSAESISTNNEETHAMLQFNLNKKPISITANY